MNLAPIQHDAQGADVHETALTYHFGEIVARRSFGQTISAAYDVSPENHRSDLYFPKKTVPLLRRKFDVERERLEERSDSERWISYLSRLSESPVGLPKDHARAVRIVWSNLASRVVNIRPPAATPCGELGFQLAWNTPRYYLDIDIDQSGRFEWFFRDKVSKEELGSDDDLLEYPPERLIQLLVRVCREE